MEWPAGVIDEARYPVFLSLRDVFTAQLLQPAGGVCRLFEIEAIGVEDACERNLAEAGVNDVGARIQGVQDGFKTSHVFRREKVGLVEDDDVTEFDLFDQ